MSLIDTTEPKNKKNLRMWLVDSTHDSEHSRLKVNWSLNHCVQWASAAIFNATTKAKNDSKSAAHLFTTSNSQHSAESRKSNIKIETLNLSNEKMIFNDNPRRLLASSSSPFVRINRSTLIMKFHSVSLIRSLFYCTKNAAWNHRYCFAA